MQMDYAAHCEEEGTPTKIDAKKKEKELEDECNSRRNVWMSDCVFGDAKIEGRR